jgi:lactam utilization protein B
MRSFTPKIIAIASLMAAVPLSSAYAVHRHRIEPQAMSTEDRAVMDQLEGVKQGIVEAMDAKAITPQQGHELMMQADSIRFSGGDRNVLSQIQNVDQQLQNDTGGGIYIGDGADGGYYPNG